MRKFALPRSGGLIAGLSVLSLMLLAGCEGTGTGLPTEAHSDYKAYQKLPHYRVFVTTGGGSAMVWSWAWAQSNAESAVEAGKRTCKEGQSGGVEFITGTGACSLHSIGDIIVWNLTGEQLKKAIELYQSNPQATNADLASGK